MQFVGSLVVPPGSAGFNLNPSRAYTTTETIMSKSRYQVQYIASPALKFKGSHGGPGEPGEDSRNTAVLVGVFHPCLKNFLIPAQIYGSGTLIEIWHARVGVVNELLKDS